MGDGECVCEEGSFKMSDGSCNNDFESLQFYLCDEHDPNRAQKAVFDKIGTNAIKWVKKLGAARPNNSDRPFLSVIGLDGNNVYVGSDIGETETSGKLQFLSGHENFDIRYLCMGKDLECEEGLFPHNYASTCDKTSACESQGLTKFPEPILLDYFVLLVIVD